MCRRRRQDRFNRKGSLRPSHKDNLNKDSLNLQRRRKVLRPTLQRLLSHLLQAFRLERRHPLVGKPMVQV